MAAITDATFYTNQTGTAGDSVVNTYPKAGTLTELPPIVRNLAGTESANDTFYIARLLPGQRLRPDLCTVTHDDAGTTLTIDIGDDSDADRYGDGVDLAAAAGVERFTDAAIPDAIPNPHTITEATQDILVTVKTTGTPNAADVVFNLVVENGRRDLGVL